MENRFLIVGLGNPGKEYVGTRHNAGFVVVERLARRWQVDWSVSRTYRARLAQSRSGERCVVLCQPQTFMNLSGEAVGKLARYHRVAAANTLVVVDDADLPLGTLRLRPEGSSGGHHGLESVEAHLGTRAYARLRLGIGRKAGDGREIADYVLSRFSAEEREVFERVLARAADQVECWLTDGIRKAMDRYNGRLDDVNNETVA
jgi:PTH1 family peptidyl-tRNA hydrolase